jgi:hypothetical protein
MQSLNPVASATINEKNFGLRRVHCTGIGDGTRAARKSSVNQKRF